MSGSQNQDQEEEASHMNGHPLPGAAFMAEQSEQLNRQIEDSPLHQATGEFSNSILAQC